jgi:hypothetical protein
LLRLQQQARSDGDDRKAEVYLKQIEAIMTNQVSSGSGSSAGSSSGASTGVGASSTISEAQGIPKLDRAESEQIVKDFNAAVDPVAARYQGSISRSTSIPKVLRFLSDVVGSLPAVCPPHGARVSA